MPGKSEVEVVDQVVLAQFPAQRASDVKAGPIRDRQRRKWWRFHRHVGCKSRRAGERGDGSYGNREFLHEKPLEFGHYNEQSVPQLLQACHSEQQFNRPEWLNRQALIRVFVLPHRPTLSPSGMRKLRANPAPKGLDFLRRLAVAGVLGDAEAGRDRIRKIDARGQLRRGEHTKAH